MITSEAHDQSFLKSVKGKVIFGFLVGIIALGASYVISKGAFEKVEGMVSQLSTPDEKLRIVNSVFQDILLLNELQTERPAGRKAGNRQVVRAEYDAHSDRLKARLDTLEVRLADSPGQLVRIDSIRYLLERRADVFEAYMRERRGLATNADLKRKVNSIAEIIATSNEAKGDSTVITTEKRTTTTTITKNEPPVPAEEDEKRGFWNKIFKGKKPKEEEQAAAVAKEPVVIQKEEVKVLIDTLTIAKNDSAIQIVGNEVKSIAHNQMVRASRFLERERQLQAGETLLVGKLMEIMREVEADVLNSMYQDNEQIKLTLHRSIKNIGIILLGVLSLTALLGFWIFADITRSGEYRKELILAKEEADYHSAAKQRFLANMSHEIRTPLQSIIGFSELVRNQPTPSRAQLEMIHKSSEHLLYLVNEILDYSRIISDSFEFVEESFELQPLLEEVVETLRPQAEVKGLMLVLENRFPPKTFLSGDTFRLKQILHNLLGNAIKFTAKGEVSLTAGPVETDGKKELRLEIRDTGIGMGPDQIRRIFNQFEQGHAGINREYGGSGLGLSIVKVLVNGQGGRITVNSKPGSYSSFEVTLPLKEGSPVEEAVFVYEDEISDEVVFDGKVWVIDDDKYILQWVRSVLELNGIPAKVFGSPLDADQAQWDPEVSVVFIDMRMPHMSGPELCVHLKKKAGSSVRFVACTAMALPGERARILEMGFDEVLMKPFKEADLLRALKKLPSLSAHADRAVPENYDATTSPLLDISKLESMTMGDEQLLKDSLEQFIEDTVADLSEIEKQVVSGAERAQLRELFHRLAGRTGQVGAAELGVKMREIEIKLAGDSFPQNDIETAIKLGYRLVDEIQEKYVS
ncbi:hypothetical protein GCM10023091_40590 [Ravibacter arvi]|uniref:histidine kinase n=1 Tax=Ravibacter arvi TaxID=2051041 RepID=A0ABP8MBQ0_9BACT